MGTVLEEEKEGRSCKKEKGDGPTKNKKRYNPQKRKETIIMENLETKIAKDLLSIEAIFLKPDDPFTWASGIKSPIYCDNRLTLTSPMVRNDVEEGLASLIQENFPGYLQGLCQGGADACLKLSPDADLYVYLHDSNLLDWGKGHCCQRKQHRSGLDHR